MFADAQIPSAHLAQSAIKISEHSVEKGLAKLICLRSLDLEPVKVQKRVQANEFKTPVERIWRAIFGEENRLPGLLDHAPIGKLSGISSQTAPKERSQRILPVDGDVDTERLTVKSY